MTGLARTIEPFLGLTKIVLAALAQHDHSTQLELRFRHAKGRGGMKIELPRLRQIRSHRTVRNSQTVVAGKRNKRMDKITGVAGTGFNPLSCDLVVNLESLVVVFNNAIAIGIHVCQCPTGARVAFFGRMAVGFNSVVFLATLVSREPELEEYAGAGFFVDTRIRIERQRGTSNPKGQGNHASQYASGPETRTSA